MTQFEYLCVRVACEPSASGFQGTSDPCKRTKNAIAKPLLVYAQSDTAQHEVGTVHLSHSLSYPMSVPSNAGDAS